MYRMLFLVLFTPAFLRSMEPAIIIPEDISIISYQKTFKIALAQQDSQKALKLLCEGHIHKNLPLASDVDTFAKKLMPIERTPLMLAIETDCLPVAEYLLKEKVDVNISDRLGRTAAMMLVHGSLVKNLYTLLLDLKPNLDLQDEDGLTVLHHCFAKPFNPDVHEYFKALCQQGAQVNLQDEWGLTPLHEAVKHQSVLKIRLLLGYNADQAICDMQGTSVIDMVGNPSTPEPIKDIFRQFNTKH